MTCTCTLGPGPCRICRPPASRERYPYIDSHGRVRTVEIPVSLFCRWCGDEFFEYVGKVPLCISCWEYAQDQAPIYTGIW